MRPEVLVEPREPHLEQALPSLGDLGRDDGGGRQDVASAQGEEHQGQAGHLPGGVIPVTEKNSIII